MTARDLVLEQIHHGETAPLPVTFSVEAEVEPRLDAHYGTTSWREWVPPYIVRVTMVDEDRPTPVSETRYRDAFGGLWNTAGVPTYQEEAPLASPSLDGYRFPAWETFVDERLRRAALATCQHCADSFRAAGFGWGLFERTWTLRGFAHSLTDAIAEVDFYEELLDRVTEMHLRFVEVSCQLPVEGIMFSDDWGDQRGVILGPERWRKLLKPRLAKLYQACHQAGKLTLTHCCGNVSEIIPDLIEIGLDVLQSIQPEAMNPYELKRMWGDKITLWGGLGSQSVIPFGTPEGIYAEVHRLCEAMSQGGGYILGAAKALQPDTPTANAAAVLEAFLQCSGHGRLAPASVPA